MLLFLLYWKINKVFVKSLKFTPIVAHFKTTAGVAILRINKYFYTVYLITVKLGGEICINELLKNPPANHLSAKAHQ